MAAEFPDEGVRLSWILQDFIPNIGGGREKLEDLTTWEVLERYTKGNTTNTSYCQNLTDQGKVEHVGTPNIFVSHWFGYKFLDVVDALWNHLKDEADTAILWWDLFSINQHVENQWTFEWLSTTFKSAIQEIGRVVMVMSPWNDPAPYKRAWCVFEAYCAISVGARFEIALGEKQEKQFVHDVMFFGVQDTIHKMLAEVRAEKSESTSTTEKELLFAAIRKEIGFEKLDAMLFERYRSWVASVAMKFAEDRGSNSAESNDRPRYVYLEIAAEIWYIQGRYEKAERLFLQLLETENHADLPETLGPTFYLSAVYNAQGKYDEAERLFLQCLEKELTNSACSAWPLVSYPNILSSMNNLASHYGSKGKYDQAECLFLQCSEAKKRELGEDALVTLELLITLATLYTMEGRYSEAEPLYLQILETKKQKHGEDHPATLGTMCTLAMVYCLGGKFAEAEALLLKCLEAGNQKLGKGHPDTLSPMAHLAINYKLQGKYAQAESLSLQCLEARKRAFGEDHPDTLDSVDELAKVYILQGKYDKGERMFLQCLEARRRENGVDHLYTLTTTTNLARIYISQGKYDEAERLFLQCLGTYKQRRGKCDKAEQPLFLQLLVTRKQKLGEDHPQALTSMNNLACLYSYQGKYDEAERLFLQCLGTNKQRHGKCDKGEQPLSLPFLVTRKQTLGEIEPLALTSMNNLAMVYHLQGKFAEAERLHVHCLETRTQTLGKDQPYALMSMNNLTCHYYSQGKYIDALRLYLQSLETRTQKLGEVHPETLTPSNNLALVLRIDLQHWWWRLVLVLFFLSMLLRSNPPTWEDQVIRFVTDTSLEWFRGIEEAQRLHLQCKEMLKQKYGEDSPDLWTHMINMAMCYESKGKYDEAENFYLLRLKMQMEMLGLDHPDTLKSMDNLAMRYKSQGKDDEAELLFSKRYKSQISCRWTSLGRRKPRMYCNPTQLGRGRTSLRMLGCRSACQSPK